MVPASDAPVTGTVAKEDVVYEVDTATFQSTVMLSEVPVILDCYADWCGPCQQLAPVIEEAVVKAGGKVHLAKLNTDNNPQLAQGLRVQSLPTVMTIHQGKLVDHFVGMQPAEQVQEYVARAVALADAAPEAEPTAELAYLRGSEALEKASASDVSSEDATETLAVAKAAFQEALQLGNLAADAEDTEKMTAAASYAGLVRIALAEKDDETATALVNALRTAYPTLASVPEVSRALSMYDLSLSSNESGDAADLRAQVNADPSNLDARLALAKELFGTGAHGPAIDECLEIVKQDNSWNDGAGRVLLLQIFEVLGDSHELTVGGRKRLASVLFR